MSEHAEIDWDRKMSDVQFFIEATDCERAALRDRNPQQHFTQESVGFSQIVGRLDDRPVVVVLTFGTVNGLRVAYWHACSEVVDHKMIRQWFDDNYTPRWSKGQRVARCDAMNFHHVLYAAQELV